MILAGDIGGTHTRLRLAECTDQDVHTIETRQYRNRDFPDLDAILTAFLAEQPLNAARLCLAVAGPVQENRVALTNLAWQLDGSLLASRHGFEKVKLINDLEAAGHGLAGSSLLTLQSGQAWTGAPMALLGVGTGLGQAIVVPHGESLSVLATEGGHMDFAPATAEQWALHQFLAGRHGHVSWERVCSGSALPVLLEFLVASEAVRLSQTLQTALGRGDPGPAISHAAASGDASAQQVIGLFRSLLGAVAGNLALGCLPDGGLYLVGGMVVALKETLQHAEFLRSFLDKGRMAERLRRIPVHIVMDDDVGLRGAARVAARL